MQSPVPQEVMVETSSQSQISLRFRTENILSTHSLHTSATNLLLAWPQTQVCVFLCLSLGRVATLFCQVWFISPLSFQIWKTEALIYFLTVEIGTPHMLQHSCFTPNTETLLGHVLEIYFCRLWICSVQSSWLLQWPKQITVLISHLANSISVILQPISQPNAFCSTAVYLSLDVKLYMSHYKLCPSIYLFNIT